MEQGHVRVGPDTITDPAFLVTRNMEDFVTWVDTSKLKRHVQKYNVSVARAISKYAAREENVDDLPFHTGRVGRFRTHGVDLLAAGPCTISTIVVNFHSISFASMIHGEFITARGMVCRQDRFVLL